MLGALNQLFSFERTEFSQKNKYGDISKKDPPVPMPNTDVKLLCAEDSEGFPLVKAGRRRSYFNWRISSVGRAPALQAGGHWFEPSILHFYLSH